MIHIMYESFDRGNCLYDVADAGFLHRRRSPIPPGTEYSVATSEWALTGASRAVVFSSCFAFDTTVNADDPAPLSCA